MKEFIIIPQKSLYDIFPQSKLIDFALLDYLYTVNAEQNVEMEKNFECNLPFKKFQKEMPLLRDESKMTVSFSFSRLEKFGFIKKEFKPDRSISFILLDLVYNIYNNIYNNNLVPKLVSRVTESVESSILVDKTKSVESRQSDNTITQKTETDENSLDSTEQWRSHKKYLKDNKEKFVGERYNYPDSQGFYDYCYLLNHGKCQPDVLFGALYWKKKESLTNGEFSYKFNNKEKAWQSFVAERSNARKLAMMMSVKEFSDLMEKVDEMAYNEKMKKYDFEWKLSTLLKNISKL
jgi:DNA-binding transcriptional regulator GbsR (MarR family)